MSTTAEEASQPVSEFPADPAEVNWKLLSQLGEKPHPLIRDIDMSGMHYGVQEVLTAAKVVHHLLDLIDVPHGLSFAGRTTDGRTLLSVLGVMNLRSRLDRIAGWHARETGPAGTVGDYCTECGHRWPCGTRRMADGNYQDEDDQ